MYEAHARPFETAIPLAHLGPVMNSYSEHDGVPIGATHAILTELLCERLKVHRHRRGRLHDHPWLASRQRGVTDH